MTETRDARETDWLPVLREISRTAGHELRNSLNALVVNLEVVRSRSDRMDAAVQPFVTQAVEQAEESIRLAEGTIALLNLIANSVGPDGVIEARFVAPGRVAVGVTEGEAQRAARAIQHLAKRTGGSVEAGDATVILSIPEKAQENKE